MVGLHAERATLRERLLLRYAREALAIAIQFAPTLQVVQTETLHIEFAHTLIGNVLDPIILSHIHLTTSQITRCVQRIQVSRRTRIVGSRLTAVGLGSNQILLSQTERLGHRHVVEVARRDIVAVAVVLDQQRPRQRVVVARLCSIEIRSVAHIVLVVEVEHPLRRNVIGIEIVVVGRIVQEHRAERTAIRGFGEAHLPDGLGRQIVCPHIVEEGHIRRVERRGRRECVGFVRVVDHTRRVIDSRLPILHIERHTCVQSVCRTERQVVVRVEIVFDRQQLLGLSQIAEHQLIRVVERGTSCRLGCRVQRAHNNTQLLLGRCGIVGLAEEFDQLRVAQRTNGIDLTSIRFEHIDTLVVGLRLNYPIDTLQEEVTVCDHTIQSRIDRLHLRAGRADIPLPDRAVGVGVAIDGIDQIALDIGQQREVAAPQSRALHRGIDTRQRLLGLFEGLHRVVLGDCRLRILVQTRGCRQGNHRRQHIYFDE